LVAIAETIIERRSGAFEPASFRDRYQDALRELVEAKTEGLATTPRAIAEPPKVINLKLAGTVPLFVGRRAAAVSLVIPEIVAAAVLGAFPRVLIGLMAADHAARSSAEQAVMAGIMPCHPTDGSTL
jgi:hypothetical protein